MFSIFFACFFVPFIFSFVFIFLTIRKKYCTVILILSTSLFSFFAILTSSVLQLFVSLLFPKLLQQHSILNILFISFIYSGTIEETTKFIFFSCILFFFINPHIKKSKLNISPKIERQQILILSMFFASCFAGFENISYLVFDINSLPIRLITASLFHIFIAPYYLKAISKENAFCFVLLTIPIFLHGIYNMFAMIEGVLLPLSFLIIIFLFIKTLIILS